MIAKNPKNDNIAIYETDGYSINRISVWDWSTQKKVFAKRVPYTVSSLQYTEKGTYLMVGTTSEEGVYFLDQKGDVISKIKDPIEMVTFALSSKTEKSCVLYTPIGYLEYINLTTREKKAELVIEQSLEQPVLFSNRKGECFADNPYGIWRTFQNIHKRNAAESNFCGCTKTSDMEHGT